VLLSSSRQKQKYCKNGKQKQLEQTVQTQT